MPDPTATERAMASEEHAIIEALKAENARLREAEAHLWAMVVWFGGTYENPNTTRDVAAAARYVERYLAESDDDMTARHREVLAREVDDLDAIDMTVQRGPKTTLDDVYREGQEETTP